MNETGEAAAQVRLVGRKPVPVEAQGGIRKVSMEAAIAGQSSRMILAENTRMKI